jgi:hypothetical protein
VIWKFRRRRRAGLKDPLRPGPTRRFLEIVGDQFSWRFSGEFSDKTNGFAAHGKLKASRISRLDSREWARE